MAKKIFSIIGILIFLYIITVVHDFFQIPIVQPGVTASIKVFPNQQVSTLAQQLYDQKLIQHPLVFEWLVQLKGDRYQLRYGEYEIKYPMTAWTLLRHMIKGTDLVNHRLTIVNGWTFPDIRAALSHDTDLNQTLTNQSDQAILKTLNASENHAEGLFYPDTYFFTWGNKDISVLKTAYLKMQKILNTDWQNRATHLPYQNAYEALIAASLIERETSVDSEKPIIASVILNRLEKHMRLQIDPAVQYGLEKTFTGKITKTDLETKTPYNTYLIKGLPPTPICMPSQSSIFAALHPDKTDYLYYVATGSGGHHFSKTYAEHLKQVKLYRQTLEASH
ncbi:MAG: hypothetical protein A3F13_08510 [Gammaproteobacteria bacterium RIFCSPHIGHO2_12_FULL_40_19]|nr:MAG: hypothetical protein A3F13_08510 [Gammaproteobacteria bacterium RIFCSPHIGHO2_12_FULL_40_19]